MSRQGKPATSGQTPSQTIGPFFAYGLTPTQYGYDFSSIADGDLLKHSPLDNRVRITGTVFDGDNEPVKDAVLEIWQADPSGHYRTAAGTFIDKAAGRNDGFTGFGRTGTGTDPECRFLFHTVKPGATSQNAAPHINVVLFMRGQLNHLFTRIYFSDESDENAKDSVLQAVPEPRRHTLIANREDTADGPVYRFDIHMQGPDETVFFDY